MLALLTCGFLFALFGWLAGALAAALGVRAVWIWLAYYALSELVERRGWTHRPDWRASRFAAWVGRTLMRTRFTDESAAALRALGAGPHVFVCEPHGPACLHLVFGFAAHGGALPPVLAERTRVVAHWVYRGVPLLRNLYAAFGVIDSSAGSVRRALAAGDSVALSPSGIAGLWLSLCPRPLLDADEADQWRDAVHVWRRDSLGCFEYASRRGATVVPVLSPDEDATYRRYLTHWNLPPLVLTLGRWLVCQHLPVLEWRVGRTVPTRRGHVAVGANETADRAYWELAQLGGATHRVWVRHCWQSAAELARGAE